MRITWLRHACFMVESQGYRVVIDPFDEVTGCPNTDVEADAVLCSHEHHDHNYRAGVKLCGGKANPFSVSVVETFHDDKAGALRGSNKIHLLSAEGLKVAHLGDLGHPLSEEQAEALRGCDVMMIPVGGFYTVDGATAAAIVKQTAPRVVIPMHYRGEGFGFDVIDTVEPFLSHFPAEKVCRMAESVLELTADTPEQVAVLAFPE